MDERQVSRHVSHMREHVLATCGMGGSGKPAGIHGIRVRVLHGLCAGGQIAHRATAPSANQISEVDSPARDPLALENGTGQLPRLIISPARHARRPQGQPPRTPEDTARGLCAAHAGSSPPAAASRASLQGGVWAGVCSAFNRGARCAAPRDVPGWAEEGEAAPASVLKERSAPRAGSAHARAALARGAPASAARSGLASPKRAAWSAMEPQVRGPTGFVDRACLWRPCDREVSSRRRAHRPGPPAPTTLGRRRNPRRCAGAAAAAAAVRHGALPRSPAPRASPAPG